MNGRQFAALAKALYENKATAAIVSAVADVCEKENPRFDRARFNLAAYGAPIGQQVLRMSEVYQLTGE